MIVSVPDAMPTTPGEALNVQTAKRAEVADTPPTDALGWTCCAR